MGSNNSILHLENIRKRFGGFWKLPERRQLTAFGDVVGRNDGRAQSLGDCENAADDQPGSRGKKCGHPVG